MPMGEPELDCQQLRWKTDGLRVSTQNSGHCGMRSGCYDRWKTCCSFKGSNNNNNNDGNKNNSNDDNKNNYDNN